jgi:hypothetical protein
MLLRRGQGLIHQSTRVSGGIVSHPNLLFISDIAILTRLDIARNESPSTSTVNATSEFRKIRQSLSLLESHLTTLQRAPRPPPDATQNEARTQPQRGLLAHLSSPLASWPTQLNPGVGPTGWISYLGMRVRFVLVTSHNGHLDSSSVPDVPASSHSRINKKNLRRPVTAVRKPYWLATSRIMILSG